MGKRPDTWMPFYIGDYLRDTSRLTTEGHGAYVLLIFDYWVSGQALPDDDQQLAAITRLSVPKWKAMRPVVARFFHVGDGVWRHKRVDAELVKTTAKYQQKVDAGIASAEAKALRKVNEPSTDVDDTSQRKPQRNVRQPQPHSSLRSEDTDANASGGRAPPLARDPIKEMFDRGLALLGGDKASARSFLGKLRKEYKEIIVLEAIAKAETDLVSDPVEFLVGYCRWRKQNGTGGDAEAGLSELADWARREDERQSIRSHH